MGKKKTNKGKRQIGLCTYCGKEAPLSNDHVIPRCLFLKPFPDNMLTVPACDDCNNTKSKDDDFLRDMIVVDIDCSNNPTPQRLFKEIVIRSVRRGSSFLRNFRNMVEIRPLYTPAGLYLGEYPTVPLDGRRIVTIFEKIVKGLYYAKFKTKLPDDCKIEVLRMHPLGISELFEGFKRANQNGPYLWGESFGCSFIMATEDPFITHWLLWFFQSYFITVSTDSGKPLVLPGTSTKIEP